MKTNQFVLIFLLALLTLTGNAPLWGQDASLTSNKITASFFNDGDRWCVLGDSITHAGSYHKDVELFYLTRYPVKKLDVVNCGIAGDNAEGALKRIGWDCMSNKPTVVSLMLGMNDVKGGLYASNPDPTIMEKRKAANAAYETNMTSLWAKIVGGGAKLILITPSPYDDTASESQTLKFASNHPGQSEALRGYAERVKELATTLGVPVVDFNTPMSAITATHQKTNSSFTLIGKDRVHPGPVGHLVMAYEFLKSQGVDGTVSSIDVDASSGRVLGSSNCNISDIKTGGDGVTFQCLEKSLPYPLTKEQQPALEMIPFTQDLNMETLRIAGLPKGNYLLTIDGRKIRDYSAAQLDQGVNLALETNTPQAMQSAEVLAALSKKWVSADKIRTIVFNEFYALPVAARPLTNAAYVSQKYGEKLSASKSTNPYFSTIREHYTEYKPQEAEIQRQIQDAVTMARRLAIPREHTFSVTKVPSP